MISIVLVTYNRSKRLKSSIQDILNQTFTDFELIICDDCSTDSTEEICHQFLLKDKRVKYIRHDENLGMPDNCNYGIQHSLYDYVAILHDGDRFKPDLLEQWYQAISNNDSVGFVFNAIGRTDGVDDVLNASKQVDPGVVKKEYLLQNVFFRTWLFGSIVFGEAMVRKELLVKYGYLKKKYGFYADVDLWMELLHSNDAFYCKDALIVEPTKVIQPRLFNDNLITYCLYMYGMHWDHRKKEYRRQPFKLALELVIFCVQAFFNLNYHLLLLVKNHSSASIVEAGKALYKKNILLLVPWAVMLFFSPIIKLLFTVRKLFLKKQEYNLAVQKNEARSSIAVRMLEDVPER